MLFVEVVLPVLCIPGAGFAFGRFSATDMRPLSRFTLVILSPALIFGYLATAEVAVAVMVLLALEYGARPDLVAGVTVVTTIVSAATVTGVLYFLAWAF